MAHNYTSRLLQSIGLDAPHEKVGENGSVSWKHIAPGNFCYLGKGKVEPIINPDFKVILHQVRNPLNTLSSSFTFSESTWHYMENRLGITPEKSSCRFDYFTVVNGETSLHSDFKIKFNTYLNKIMRYKRDNNAVIRRAMRCYLYWNKLIENQSDWRFQVENLNDVWSELLERIGADYKPMPELSRSAKDSRVDRQSYRSLSVSDLRNANCDLCNQIIDMASRYGYNLS